MCCILRRDVDGVVEEVGDEGKGQRSLKEYVFEGGAEAYKVGHCRFSDVRPLPTPYLVSHLGVTAA